MTVAPAPASTGQVAPDRVPRLSYFFPAHNEEANLEGLVAEALEALPAIADQFEIIAVERRLEGPDGRDRRPARGRASGRRARRPPPGEPRLRRRAAVGLRGLALRAARVHRRRPPVPRGRPRPAHGPARRGGPPGRRRRLPDQARRPGHPRRLRAHLQARQPDLLRPQGQGRRLRLQAVPPRGARGRAGRVRRRVLLGRAADQGPGRRTVRRAGRDPALPADRRLADRREAVGHLARGEGLLGPAPPDVGEPRARGPAGPADPGRAEGSSARR